MGVPRRVTAADAPKATRALFGSGGSGQLPWAPSSQGGTPTAAAVAAASGGLEEEDPLLASGEYAIRCAVLAFCCCQYHFAWLACVVGTASRASADCGESLCPLLDVCSKAAQGAVNLMRDALTEAVRSGGLGCWRCVSSFRWLGSDLLMPANNALHCGNLHMCCVVLQAMPPWRRPCVEQWWMWQQWWWPYRHPQRQGQLAAACPSTQQPQGLSSSNSSSSCCCRTRHPCGTTTATLSIRQVAAGACNFPAAAAPAGSDVLLIAPHFHSHKLPHMNHTPAPCSCPCLQALCNLPYQFAPRLQQLVHRNVNFINPATRVRRAGQECLAAMVGGQLMTPPADGTGTFCNSAPRGIRALNQGCLPAPACLFFLPAGAAAGGGASGGGRRAAGLRWPGFRWSGGHQASSTLGQHWHWPVGGADLGCT